MLQHINKNQVVVERAVHYQQRFPASKVTVKQLVDHFWNGGSVEPSTGALYFTAVGLPSPDLDAVPEEIDPRMAEKVSVQELAEADVAYDIVSEDKPFILETLEWWDNTLGSMTIEVDADLRGFHSTFIPEATLWEPLLEEEALEFIVAVLAQRSCPGEHPSNSHRQQAIESIRYWGESLSLQGVVHRGERIYSMLGACWMMVPDEKLFAVKERYSEEDWSRIRASVRRNNIGAAWSHDTVDCILGKDGRVKFTKTLYFIGERLGVTVGREQQNDLDYTKFEQYHQPGERIDGHLLFGEALQQAAQEDWFTRMYDSEKVAPDKGPANRQSSEYGLYLWRQSHSRGEMFAEKAWRFLTWPLPLVEEGMTRLKRLYNESCRDNAPGPGRHWRDGRWHNVPLEGEAALTWLRAAPGTLAGRSILLNEVRVWKGEEWHKNCLNKTQFGALCDIFEHRMGRTIAAGQLPTYDGLPVSYIIQRYGTPAGMTRTAEEVRDHADYKRRLSDVFHNPPLADNPESCPNIEGQEIQHGYTRHLCEIFGKLWPELEEISEEEKKMSFSDFVISLNKLRRRSRGSNK